MAHGSRTIVDVDGLGRRRHDHEPLPSAISHLAISHEHYALTAWVFSQSLRNFSRPMLVSGWLNSESITAGGQVQMSAPRRAASTMWIGLRVLATRISVAKS